MLLDMNADIVYQVAKALSRKEQKLLLHKLKLDLFSMQHKSKPKTILTKFEAMEYLLEKVFKVKK